MVLYQASYGTGDWATVRAFQGNIPAQRAVCSQPELTRAESGEGSVEFLSPRSGQSPLLLTGPGEEQQEADCMSPNPGTHHPVSHPDRVTRAIISPAASLKGREEGNCSRAMQ